VTRVVVLHAEPVAVLLRPRSKKHRQVLAFVEAVQPDRWRRSLDARLVVPTTVRVEAGWDRRAPESALVNRLGIADHVLDGEAADRAASLRTQHGVSPADAHVGAAAHHHAGGDVVVLTSDPGDIAAVTAGTGARIVPL
jgi:predicted nucleic acid-binding protein